MTSKGVVISFPRLADMLKGYLRNSARSCMIGGDCAALSGIHDTIEDFCQSLEVKYDYLVLASSGAHGRDDRGSPIASYRELYNQLSAALQSSYPACALGDSCSALSSMARQVSDFFVQLEGQGYVVLAREETALRLNAEQSDALHLVRNVGVPQEVGPKAP